MNIDFFDSVEKEKKEKMNKNKKYSFFREKSFKFYVFNLSNLISS